MRILVVEDEIRLAANITSALREVGFAVDQTGDGESGMNHVQQDIYDAMILDLMLPIKTGQEVLREMRSRRIHTPVLILTAQEGKGSVVDLLNLGADDYLAKPFDLGELIARVNSLIRRAKGNSAPTLSFGDVEVDTVRQVVSRHGQNVELSPTEYRILEYLMHRPKAVVSKRELLEHLYDFAWEHHSNVIEAHVSNLRKKISLGTAESPIETLRSRGYRLRGD